MPIEEYHSKKDYLSKSMLGDFADCPARFKHMHIDNAQPKQTKSLRLGSAVHTLALEPELWQGGYHVLPATYYNKDGEEQPFRNDLRMDVVQDQYQAAGYEVFKDDDKKWQIKENEKSKVILTKKEFELVEKMANALAKDNYAVSILKASGFVESSIFFDYEIEDPLTGEIIKIPMRCRPDLTRNDSVLADVKIAQSVKPEFFNKSAYDYHYDLSVAISFAGYESYHGKPADNYVFVAVESVEPFLVECFESIKPMDELSGISYLDYGRAHLDALLRDYVQCKRENIWPGYQRKIGSMTVPHWALNKYIQKGEF